MYTAICKATLPITFAILCFSCGVAQGASCTIKGTVLSGSKSPLEGATVTLTGASSTQITQTDVRGTYGIAVPPPQVPTNYTISFQATGYGPVTKQIQVQNAPILCEIDPPELAFVVLIPQARSQIANVLLTSPAPSRAAASSPDPLQTPDVSAATPLNASVPPSPVPSAPTARVSVAASPHASMRPSPRVSFVPSQRELVATSAQAAEAHTTTPTVAQLTAYNQAVNASYAAAHLTQCLALDTATRAWSSGDSRQTTIEMVAVSATTCLAELQVSHDYIHTSTAAYYVPMWLRSRACNNLKNDGVAFKPCVGIK